MREGRTAPNKGNCNDGVDRGKMQLVDDPTFLQLTDTGDDASCVLKTLVNILWQIRWPTASGARG